MVSGILKCWVAAQGAENPRLRLFGSTFGLSELRLSFEANHFRTRSLVLFASEAFLLMV